MVCLSPLFPYWSFVWIFYPLFKVEYWSLWLLLCCCLFHTLVFFNVYFMYLGLPACSSYIFLVYWSFYHYILSFFFSYDDFWLKVYFINNFLKIRCTTASLGARYCDQLCKGLKNGKHVVLVYKKHNVTRETVRKAGFIMTICVTLEMWPRVSESWASKM